MLSLYCLLHRLLRSKEVTLLFYMLYIEGMYCMLLPFTGRGVQSLHRCTVPYLAPLVTCTFVLEWLLFQSRNMGGYSTIPTVPVRDNSTVLPTW